MNLYEAGRAYARRDAKKKGIPHLEVADLTHPMGGEGPIEIQYIKDFHQCPPYINIVPGHNSQDSEVNIRLADIPKFIKALQKFIPRKR